MAYIVTGPTFKGGVSIIGGPLVLEASQGVVIPTGVPSDTTNKLYNSGGSLYFNGNTIGSGGGGSTPTRSSVSITTSTLAVNASELDAITIPKDCTIISIETSTLAWVRLYNNSTSRTNDINRSSQIPPPAGSGCFVDTLKSGVSWISPLADFANADSPLADVGYLTIVNKSSSSSAITITITYR